MITMRGRTGRAVLLTGLQQTNLALPSSWLCLCDRTCLRPCRTSGPSAMMAI
jgi:hypothetical protein